MGVVDFKSNLWKKKKKTSMIALKLILEMEINNFQSLFFAIFIEFVYLQSTKYKKLSLISNDEKIKNSIVGSGL